MLNISETPVLQLLAIGVTVIIAVIGIAPVLMAIKEAISPVPIEAKPILGVSFIHS